MKVYQSSISIMESGDHFKNGASLKGQMSKGKTQSVVKDIFKTLLKLPYMIVFLGISFHFSAQNTQSNQRQGQDYPQVLNIRDQYDTKDTPKRVRSTDKQGGFSIHAGGVFPVGFFYEEPTLGIFSFDGGFSASSGFNVGLKGKIPLALDGMGIFISGDFLYNGLKGTMKHNYDEAEKTADKVIRHRYLNIPFFAGLNYKVNFAPMYAFWLESGIGPNLRLITASKVTEYDGWDTYSYEEKFDMQTSFAFQVGGGFMINDLVSIGFHYYGLGKTKIKGKYTEIYLDEPLPYTFYSSELKKYSQNCLLVRLGIHF